MAPALPDISVVVATRDRRARLSGLLDSLSSQTLDAKRFEVVVVDDGSRDDTWGLLEDAAEGSGLALTPLRRERPAGPAAARNTGWRAARGNLVAFTDDDCEADPVWLEELLGAAGDENAIVQGPTSPIPAELDRIGPFSRTRHIEDPGPWFATCNILYPRALLERLDGFDESFPEALGEDTDLGWRAQESGATSRFAPRARVFHAVDDLGPARHLRGAVIGSDAVLAFRRHPRLRKEALRFGVVRTPAHLLFALALAGAMLARSRRLALLLMLPYGRYLASRCRADHAPLAFAPYYALYDALHLYATLRGDLRHRVLVI